MKNNVYEIDLNGFIVEYYVGEFVGIFKKKTIVNEQGEEEESQEEELIGEKLVIDGVDDISTITNQLIMIDLPQGLYKPKWNGGSWVEGLTEEEIFLISNPILEPQPPSLDERVEIAETEIVDIKETMDVLFGGAV